MTERPEDITRVTAEEARRLKSKTDLARLDALTEADIEKAVAADPDAVPLDTNWTDAHVVMPPGKEIVTLRLDRDVLDWFKQNGRGYQTRINAVLRSFYETRSHEQTTRR